MPAIANEGIMATILVIDDAEALRLMFTRLLTLIGHSVVTADNGQTALLLLAQMPPPDLILCDVQMPVMDGLTFARQLPTVLPRPVPLILMSLAYNTIPSDIAYAAFLAKPFQVDEFYATVAQVLGGTASSNQTP